jgi:hypothetical protein
MRILLQIYVSIRSLFRRCVWHLFYFPLKRFYLLIVIYITLKVVESVII